MLVSVAKALFSSSKALWLIAVPLFATGCAVHGTWYHPQASVGQAVDKQCGTAKRNNVWALKRKGVGLDVQVSSAKPGYRGPAVTVSLTVPESRNVEMPIGNVQVYGKSLKSMTYSLSIYSGYPEGNPVKLPQDIQALDGSRYATKAVPETYYYIALILKGKPPPSFTVVLPHMKIDGHKYPPFTIYFTRKAGAYFIMGINC